MSPATLLIIALLIIIVFVALLIFNHLVQQRMINASSGLLVHVEKIKEKPIEEEVPQAEVAVEEKPTSKPRERTSVAIKPSEEHLPVVVERKSSSEIRRKLRRSIMSKEIWNRIWS